MQIHVEALVGSRTALETFPLRLRDVPYRYLSLCCTAPYQVSPKDVKTEKQSRRRRFIAMSDAELESCRQFLTIEEMLDDVLTERNLLNAPAWESLTPICRAWFTSICLSNHLNDPALRIAELITLVYQAEVDHTAKAFLLGSIAALASACADLNFTRARKFANELADNLRQYMVDAEIATTGPLINGYFCTSDCFSSQ